MKVRLVFAAFVVLSFADVWFSPDTRSIATAQPSSGDAAGGVDGLPPQTILPPGLYLFQTRTRDGSCDDAPRTGYVTSAIATLDGVPGSRVMTLQLLNSKYWPTWKLNITAADAVIGDANIGGAATGENGTSHFELHEKKGRYQGVGSRTYPGKSAGKATSCTLNYDALLKPIE